MATDSCRLGHGNFVDLHTTSRSKPSSSHTMLTKICFLIIHLLSSTIQYSRAYSDFQQQVNQVVLEPQETNALERPAISHMAMQSHQPGGNQYGSPRSDLYHDTMKLASFVLPIDQAHIFNLSLPKSETHFVNYIRDPKTFTFLSDSDLKNCTSLSSINGSKYSLNLDDINNYEKHNIVISNTTDPSAQAITNDKSTGRENQIVYQQQFRSRRASATKLKNYIPVDRKMSTTSQYMFANESNQPIKEKMLISKRSDLVADSTSSPLAKTMVLVTTKSRKFSELVPLEELIVAPTNVHQDMNLISPLFDGISQPINPHQSGPPLFLASSIGQMRNGENLRPDISNVVSDSDDNTHRGIEGSSNNIPAPIGLRSNQDHNLIVSSNKAYPTQPQIIIQSPSKPLFMTPNLSRPVSKSKHNDADYDDGDDDEDGPNDVSAIKSVISLNQQQSKSSQQPQMKSQVLASKMNPSIQKRLGPQPVHPVQSDNLSYVRNTQQDLNVAAGHYYKKKKPKHKKPKKKKKHHDHGKYYMYAKVPKKKTWEFGYKRGNKKHKIERHEKGHKSHFKTKVKWEDKKSKGKGIHIWDYNHFDKKKKKF